MAETRPAGWRSELSRIRYRLLSINLLIVSVPLLGLGFARFYEREMLRMLEDDMIQQATLLRQVVLDDPAGMDLAGRAPLLVAAARQTRMRVRLLDQAGNVEADSHAAGPPEGIAIEAPTVIAPTPPAKERPPPESVDLASRPEVQKALAGSYGAASRVWQFEGGERVYLFSALPIVDASGAVRGAVYVTRSTQPVVAAMHRLRATLWKVLVGAFAVTAVLTLFLAATIARPLGQLTRVAQRIASGARVEPMRLERRDEIGELARAVDTMAQRLDARAHEVAELSANLSHEFKSPLTSIRGAAELLLEGAADDAAARKLFLENILADAGRLDRLVTRLLELSRTEADTTPADRVDVAELLDAAIASCHGPLSIHLDYRARTRTITARPALLTSMIRNLLDNAQRHAEAGSRVAVRVDDSDGSTIRIAVSNAGEPISEANLSRVWDRFFTTHGSEGGTGLGLPIVASVARAHGGSVAVESSRDAGTTFVVHLPV